MNPNHALAWNARGYAHFLLRNYKDALADLNRAIELDANYANAYHNRAAVRRSLHDLAGAGADLERERQVRK